MARYLIRLGRETGEGRHANRALAMLDDILGRLGPLGLALRRQSAATARAGSRRAVPGVWGLHAMLIETMLDLAGLDYDAPTERLILAPALPPAWPQIGLSSGFRCGAVSYRLERPVGGVAHRLTLDANLHRPATLRSTSPAPACPTSAPGRPSPPAPSLVRSRHPPPVLDGRPAGRRVAP